MLSHMRSTASLPCQTYAKKKHANTRAHKLVICQGGHATYCCSTDPPPTQAHYAYTQDTHGRQQNIHSGVAPSDTTNTRHTALQDYMGHGKAVCMATGRSSPELQTHGHRTTAFGREPETRDPLQVHRA
jgi:hypothetical protein